MQTSTSALINTVKVVDLVPFGPGRECGGFYALRLTRPEGPAWQDWAPGQYVMVRPEAWGPEMTWARPFSICMVARELVLFFQVVGRGTGRLETLKHGDPVQLVGPLGTSFAVEREAPTLLLAGGMGIAPFVGYVQKHPAPSRLTLRFGHRIPLEYYPFDLFDGKIYAYNHHEKEPGDLERFLEVVESQIREYAEQNGLVLACGPKPFLRAVQDMCFRHGAKAQLSLESRMACGVGACLGCVVQPLLDSASGKNRSAHPVPELMHKGLPVPSCTCGPVFWADSLDLGA